MRRSAREDSKRSLSRCPGAWLVFALLTEEGGHLAEFDVVGLGGCAWDRLAVIERYPSVDTKNEVLHYEEQGGGPVATALVTLARLGASTRFLGKLADDDDGKLAVESLGAEGVDVRRVLFQKTDNPSYVFVVIEKETGTRTIFYSRGDLSPMTPEELDRNIVTSGKILHVDRHQIAAAIVAAQWAQEAGSKVVVDAEGKVPGMDALLDLADYIVGSSDFARATTGKNDVRNAARELLRAKTSAVVVTAGDAGGVCVSHEGEFWYPAFSVDVVDTTGAGDVFHGAFNYGILQGWSLHATTRFASAVAALKCRALGGRTGIPSLEEALHFLEERGGVADLAHRSDSR
jgi:sugar/nucleoside kinase (ribokinase family)